MCKPIRSKGLFYQVISQEILVFGRFFAQNFNSNYIDTKLFYKMNQYTKIEDRGLTHLPAMPF
jgi:hypothetical protein